MQLIFRKVWQSESAELEALLYEDYCQIQEELGIFGSHSSSIYDSSKCKKIFTYDSQTAKSSAKPNIRDTKVMFCIWWQQKDVLYYKLQNSGETVNAERLHYLENSDWEVLPHRPYSTYTATSDYHLLSMQSAHTACDSQQRQYIKDWLDSFLIIMTSQLSQSKPRKSNTALFEILIVYAHIFWRKPSC